MQDCVICFWKIGNLWLRGNLFLQRNLCSWRYKRSKRKTRERRRNSKKKRRNGEHRKRSKEIRSGKMETGKPTGKKKEEKGRQRGKRTNRVGTTSRGENKRKNQALTCARLCICSSSSCPHLLSSFSELLRAGPHSSTRVSCVRLLSQQRASKGQNLTRL